MLKSRHIRSKGIYYIYSMINQKGEVYQDIYGKLKKLIVTKKLTPGQLIVQQRLSLSLNVEVESISFVLNQLQEEFLLVGTASDRLMVRELSEQEISQMFDCRIALETMTVRLFTQNAPQSKIDDLRSLLIPFENGPHNAYVFQKIDRHFHEHIAKYCGNPMLYDLFKKARILAFMDLIGLVRPLNQILREHLDIISAIHHRDEELAAYKIADYLEKTRIAHL